MDDQKVELFKCQSCGCEHKGYDPLHSACPVCGQKNNPILETLWDPETDPQNTKPPVTR
jgi:hypothetical protein